NRRSRLGGPKPIESRALTWLSSLGPIVRVSNGARAAAEEVGVEREDDVSLAKVEDLVDVPGIAERDASASARVLRGEGLVHVPSHGWESRLELGELARERRRCDGSRQDVQPATVASGDVLENPAQTREEIRPDRDAPLVPHGLRPIRIIELEDRGLSLRVGASDACRMLRVPFELDRPTCVAFG